MEKIVMILNLKTTLNQQDKNINNIPVGQFYIRVVGTKANNENISITSTLPKKKL